MGRPAHGVIGMRLDEGDAVVSMATVKPEDKLLTITENGFGKVSLVGDYRKTHRGGMGVITIKTNDRNGRVVSVRTISDDDELILTSLQGMVIRVPAEEIRTMGRSTMGVTIMRLSESDKITAVARLVGAQEKLLVAQTESKEDTTVIPTPAENDDASED
jgi:DNA gyrase subunit A